MELSARALRAEGSSSHHRPRPAGSSLARCSYWCIGGLPVGSCGPTRHWNCSPSVHQVRCVLAACSFSTCSHPSALPPAYCCGKEFLVPWRPVPPCLPHATPSLQLASMLSRPRPPPAGQRGGRRQRGRLQWHLGFVDLTSLWTPECCWPAAVPARAAAVWPTPQIS